MPRKPAKLVRSATLKPCPCCGEAHEAYWAKDRPMGLHAGVESATSFCVRCYSCGLRMVRNKPDDWPPETKRMSVAKSLEWIDRDTLAKAIEAWNQRV